MRWKYLFQGEKSLKIIDGKSQCGTPFVGIKGEGEDSEMGVGILWDNGKINFWGLLVPHEWVQCWRGMKILEQVNTISDSTLCACWTVADSSMDLVGINSADDDYCCVIELTNKVGGIENLQDLRAKVFELPLPDFP